MISIVTPCLNRVEFVETAIDSVRDQSYPAAEHIVIDGGSTDGTTQVLAAYPDLNVVSERDEGLYDAINKGIRRAKGDVVALVNTDDQLLPGALEAVASAFAENPEADCVCGRVRIVPIDGTGTGFEIGTSAMQRLRQGDVISGLTLTNARFFRREVFARVGLFDQSYPVLADRDFLGRVWLSDLRTVPIDLPLYRYGMHQDSLTLRGEVAPIAHILEACRLAEDRLRDAKTESEFRFYRRWLAWAVGYAALSNLRRMDGAPSLTVLGRVLKLHPIWFADFISQLGWHIRTRHERQGQVVRSPEN